MPAPDGEKGHGCFFAAGKFLQRDGGFVLDPGQDLRTVSGLADSRRTEGQQVLRLVPGGEFPGFQHELRELVLACVVDAAIRLQVLDQGQRPFMRREGHRARARVGVHQEEMDSIGPDIEDA